ncbi:MAG: site-2 protease family protein, partial [Cyclobacteriaceae bacterium]
MKRIHIIQLLLFITTFVTVTLSGEYWMHGKLLGVTEFTWADFQAGLWFTLPFLGFLTVHEFGHYFTARSHKVNTTLPYYIPLPPFFLVGTLGAVIRIREKIESKTKYFDIGIAGPLAGFVIAVASLAWGFTHLPDESYLYEIHPEYAQAGMQESLTESDSVINLTVGKNILYLA